MQYLSMFKCFKDINFLRYKLLPNKKSLKQQIFQFRNMSSEQGTSEVLAMMEKIHEEHPNLKIDFVDVVSKSKIKN